MCYLDKGHGSEHLRRSSDLEDANTERQYTGNAEIRRLAEPIPPHWDYGEWYAGKHAGAD